MSRTSGTRAPKPDMHMGVGLLLSRSVRFWLRGRWSNPHTIIFTTKINCPDSYMAMSGQLKVCHGITTENCQDGMLKLS